MTLRYRGEMTAIRQVVAKIRFGSRKQNTPTRWSAFRHSILRQAQLSFQTIVASQVTIVVPMALPIYDERKSFARKNHRSPAILLIEKKPRRIAQRANKILKAH